ncbi:hypothetical protein [Elioraea rosea]|uniref:hypothetical protein n=1 Tax=Elioraea rosea TaxID=2492390 RepID=UPI001181CEA9|nr:hypothetical protein [Elioraea rosea]
MRRRLLLVAPLAASACAIQPTVVEVIDSGTMPFPVMPGLVVPAVSLPPTQSDRDEATAIAREGLRTGIGERPVADPASDAALVAQARARGLPRVVQLTVVRASRTRVGLFGRTTIDTAIRMRVLDVRTGWAQGDATFLRRTTRGTEDLAAEVAALAASLLA